MESLRPGRRVRLDHIDPRDTSAYRSEEDARARLESASVPSRQLFERVEHVVNSFCPGLAKMPYRIDHFGGEHHSHTHAHYAG